jgi:hypothetical protein
MDSRAKLHKLIREKGSNRNSNSVKKYKNQMINNTINSTEAKSKKIDNICNGTILNIDQKIKDQKKKDKVKLNKLRKKYGTLSKEKYINSLQFLSTLNDDDKPDDDNSKHHKNIVQLYLDQTKDIEIIEIIDANNFEDNDLNDLEDIEDIEDICLTKNN